MKYSITLVLLFNLNILFSQSKFDREVFIKSLNLIIKADSLLYNGEYKESIQYYNKSKNIYPYASDISYKKIMALSHFLSDDDMNDTLLLYLNNGLHYYSKKYCEVAPSKEGIFRGNEKLFDLFLSNSYFYNNSDSLAGNDFVKGQLKILNKYDQLRKSNALNDKWILQHDIDSINRQELIRIIKNNGWPGIKSVGKTYSTYSFFNCSTLRYKQ